MGAIFKIWDEYISPAEDEGLDIGSSALRFKDLYLSGFISIGGNITFADTLGITFGVTRPVILKADSAAGIGTCRLQVLGGTDEDIELYFKGTSNTGSITFMEDEDYFVIPDLLSSSGSYHYFRDLQISITSANDGHLDLTADTSIDLNGSVVNTGKVITYNNIATEGYGHPAIVDDIILTEQLASIGSTNFTNSGVAGTYKLNYYLLCTTLNAGATSILLTVSWTDGAGATTSSSSSLPLTALGRTSGDIFIQLASGNTSYTTTLVDASGLARYALYMTMERMN
jgi:hypothetical protein